MKEWFQNLKQQERQAVIFGGAALLLLILYVAVWEPFVGNYDKLQKNTEKYERLVAWMEVQALEVKRLKSSMGVSMVQRGNQSILGTVDKTAKQLLLADAVKQVRPDGQNKARVRLENAPFDKVIRWLEVLQQQQGINVVSSSIEKQAEPGLVNVRLLFEDANQ